MPDETEGNATSILEYLIRKQIPVKCGVSEASEKSGQAIRKSSPGTVRKASIMGAFSQLRT